MAKAKPKKSVSELKVVFDTSVLYSGVAHNLLNNEARQLIKDNSTHSDIKISWYMPEVVMHERQYQMQNKGFELLLPINKLEKILGHNLNITKEIIERKIKDTVKDQLQELNIQISKLDNDKVDWDRLTLDAIYRRPPFEKAEKEKGFRDSLIVETFLQIVSSSPSTPKICRIALVAEDKLLRETVENRTVGLKNIRILSNFEELKGLINILVSTVEEEFVKEILGKVIICFFENDNKNSLFVKEQIDQRIELKFYEKLYEIPEGADRRENGTWNISIPRFVKKTGQRTTWISQIRVEAKAYKNVEIAYQRSPMTLADCLHPDNLFSYTDKTGFAKLGKTTKDFEDRVFRYTPPPKSESLFAKGNSVFEITWSVSVNVNKKFSNPKIKKIEFIETTWE